MTNQKIKQPKYFSGLELEDYEIGYLMHMKKKQDISARKWHNY